MIKSASITAAVLLSTIGCDSDTKDDRVDADTCDDPGGPRDGGGSCRIDCPGLDQVASDVSITQGIAGITATISDGCANDCCKCSIGWSADRAPSLSIVRTDTLITSRQDAEDFLSRGVERVGLIVESDYELVRDVGSYLACLFGDGWRTCVPIEVEAERVTTVHLYLGFASGGLAVVLPNGELGACPFAVHPEYACDPPCEAGSICVGSLDDEQWLTSSRCESTAPSCDSNECSAECDTELCGDSATCFDCDRSAEIFYCCGE